MMMTKTEIAEEVERLLLLPYTIEIRADDDGSWFAKIKELRGCMTTGRTRLEALEMLDSAMRDWLEAAIEDGETIPKPEEEREYSGRFVIRVPASLHRTLAELATCEGVSLNQLIVSELSKSVGHQKTEVPSTALAYNGPISALRFQSECAFVSAAVVQANSDPVFATYEMQISAFASVLGTYQHFAQDAVDRHDVFLSHALTHHAPSQ